jgi:tRNA pseudouridine(55) synthase
MNFELVIFDCDGVLVDSEPIANRVLVDLLSRSGLPMTYDETMKTFVGRSAATCLRMIEERIGRSLPKTFPQQWEERLFSALRREVRPIPGVVEALDRIRLPVCVASSGSHERIRVSLGASGLLPRFEGRLFSSVEVARGKPCPDLFMHAAATLGVSRYRCAVVEDTPVGVRAAVEAGMTVFGYVGGPHSSATELTDAGAIVFDSMADLPRLLGSETRLGEAMTSLDLHSAPGAADLRPEDSGDEGRGAAARRPDGLILIDKPEGPTSHDVVDAVRRTLGGVRCGHAGTLDPFASGLLVLAVGKGTRLLRFLSQSAKSYEGLVRLGLATETDDRTGRPLAEPRSVAFSDSDLQEALRALQGEFEQIAPDYSARKHRGVPHYRLARRGREVPKKPTRVRVRWEQCRRLEPDLLRIRLTVSAGTYIRALARDLGEMLRCGGHLEALRRLTSGPFGIEDAIPAASDAAALRAALIPLEMIPLGLPTIRMDDDAAQKFRSGAVVPIQGVTGEAGARESGTGGVEAAGIEAGARVKGWVRLLDHRGILLGLGQVDDLPEGTAAVKPRIVF